MWKAEFDRVESAHPSLPLTTSPGRFYPFISRPVFGGGEPRLAEKDKEFLTPAKVQLMIFCRDLDKICRTIEPAAANFSSYGHEIRNLLILVCTEVESMWKNVCRSNGLKNAENTRKYVLLQNAMRLEGYTLSFRKYPYAGAFSPFVKWGFSEATTKDIPWYDAYNSVKHDREANFKLATLQSVFNAVSACAIMLIAQFGAQHVIDPETGSYFRWDQFPDWPINENYVADVSARDTWSSIPYPWP